MLFLIIQLYYPHLYIDKGAFKCILNQSCSNILVETVVHDDNDSGWKFFPSNAISNLFTLRACLAIYWLRFTLRAWLTRPLFISYVLKATLCFEFTLPVNCQTGTLERITIHSVEISYPHYIWDKCTLKRHFTGPLALFPMLIHVALKWFSVTPLHEKKFKEDESSGIHLFLLTWLKNMSLSFCSCYLTCHH